MAAVSDPDEYGRMVTFEFPLERNVPGPENIAALIAQDTEISQQISLWDPQGSRVIRGNLLIVPIEESLLYVQPIYLLGEGSRLPELERVVAVVGETIKMESTLSDALEAIFQGRPSQVDVEGPSGQTVAHRPWSVIVTLEFADEPTAARLSAISSRGPAGRSRRGTSCRSAPGRAPVGHL